MLNSHCRDLLHQILVQRPHQLLLLSAAHHPIVSNEVKRQYTRTLPTWTKITVFGDLARTARIHVSNSPAKSHIAAGCRVTPSLGNTKSRISIGVIYRINPTPQGAISGGKFGNSKACKADNAFGKSVRNRSMSYPECQYHHLKLTRCEKCQGAFRYSVSRGTTCSCGRQSHVDASGAAHGWNGNQRAFDPQKQYSEGRHC